MIQCDRVLVEGDSQTDAPKIEVHSAVDIEQSMATTDRCNHSRSCD